MTAYRVTILHDACTTHDVEAETEAEAIEAAMNEGGVALCHQCSDKVEMGDPIRAACVENIDSGEANLDADPDHEVALLRARVAELEAAQAQPAAPAAEVHAYGETADGARLMLIGKAPPPPEAQRLMTMLLGAFGSRHPAVDDLVSLVFRVATPPEVSLTEGNSHD